MSPPSAGKLDTPLVSLGALGHLEWFDFNGMLGHLEWFDFIGILGHLEWFDFIGILGHLGWFEYTLGLIIQCCNWNLIKKGIVCIFK